MLFQFEGVSSYGWLIARLYTWAHICGWTQRARLPTCVCVIVAWKIGMLAAATCTVRGNHRNSNSHSPKTKTIIIWNGHKYRVYAVCVAAAAEWSAEPSASVGVFTTLYSSSWWCGASLASLHSIFAAGRPNIYVEQYVCQMRYHLVCTMCANDGKFAYFFHISFVWGFSPSTNQTTKQQTLEYGKYGDFAVM